MAVRILVVDADPTVQRALGNALSQAGFEVTAAGEGPEALRLARSDRPALVLIAANLPGVDGFTIVSRLRMEDGPSTHTPVILLLPENDTEARSKALRSGADDYLTKPFHPAELMARMRSLLARYRPDEHYVPPTRSVAAVIAPAAGPAPKKQMSAQVILFYGAKGGVGTTTIAINCAIALHKELGRRVCLIDASLQFGDHRVFLDLGLDRMSVVDLATAPTVDIDLIHQVLVKHESGIDLLLAPPSPETAELVTQDHLPSLIGLMKSDFDYIVIDMDKRLDEVNLRIMDVADTIYLIMTADLPCLKNVRLVLETIGHLGYSDAKVKLILNRSNAFTGINVKNAESALRRKIDFQIINEYRSAIGALNSGAPFMYTKSDSALGKDVLDFVKALDKAHMERPAGSPGR
ncbi:MAG TPA: response regulator [Terriglobales bacterium]|nr:response regulator [Terriglobales bacterium]